MLKSLDLFGFKSFADRTTFEFAPGITCVVGPNGSGKSNVVDAIKWILGDQSPKSLRGKEMTDVIFNGSSSRKPAGFAEATLTFDNSNGLFAIDSTEVQVGRRIYRSGEAEYLINKAPARLKDIKELFLGTGAGTAAYSIIEQGRVDSLLQATAQNRRIVFEEAAGISRFKLRKVDALRKLERVGQNLLRLTDIVDEVQGQLNTLRSQAAKATRFREASEELRALRIGLAADDYRDLTARLQEGDARFQEIAAELQRLTEEHEAVEAEQGAVDSQISDVEDRLRAVEQLAAENRESIATHEATLVHQSARNAELEAELARLEQQQQELAARAEAAIGELQQAEGSLQRYAADFAERQAALNAREQQIREIAEKLDTERDALDQARQRQLGLLQQRSVLTNRLTAFESQAPAMEAARKRAEQRLRQLDQQLAAATTELERRRGLIESAWETMGALREEVQGRRLQRDELHQKQEEQQRNLAQLREQRSAWQARRGLLEDLELRQEGLGIGVKEILSRAQTADGPPWNTVLGSVADLLVVDLERAALLEVALGNRAQVIVLSRLEPLVEYLNQGKCHISGRVGFLTVRDGQLEGVQAVLANGELAAPVLTVDGNSSAALPHLPDLNGLKGVVSRADQLIESSSGIPRLAEHLLADTWIVSSLDVALALAKSEGAGCRFVTLQGELLETDGTLYVGTVRSESALVSRKSELRGLKNDLLRLDRQISAGEAELVHLAQEVAALDQGLREAQSRLEDSSAQAAELKSSVGSQEIEVERLRRDRDELEQELVQLRASTEQLSSDSAVVQEELQKVETMLAELQVELEQADGRIAKLESEYLELQQVQGRERLDLAKQEERLHNLENARSRLDQERFERDLQREESQRRLQLIAAKREQIEKHLEAAQTESAALHARKQELAEQIAALQAEKEQVRQRRSTLAERELKLRHARRELMERQHDHELKAREVRQQIEHLAERLRDEYHVELAEVAAEGASALAPPSIGEGEPAIAEPVDGEELAESQASAALPHVSGTGTPAAEPNRRAEVEAQIDRLRRKLKGMGTVNTDSLRDLDELESRYARLNTQLQDLVEAKGALEEIVRRINAESKRMFTETFNEVRKHFQELFRKLFGGGDGDIVLEDPEDVLECGIDIVARPPGKELRSISLLSGGEKTLTAVALLLAIFKSKPSPFCILDEVDAALDEGNIERYMRVIQEFQEWTQFIVITHSKRTMTAGDVLYGVTMEESGVSKRMSVRFEDVSEDGHFRSNAA